MRDLNLLILSADPAYWEVVLSEPSDINSSGQIVAGKYLLTPTEPSPAYVALGDSYLSGEGAKDHYIDIDGDDEADPGENNDVPVFSGLGN